jgi:hypothetical protein
MTTQMREPTHLSMSSGLSLASAGLGGGSGVRRKEIGRGGRRGEVRRGEERYLGEGVVMPSLECRGDGVEGLIVVYC